MTCTTKALSEKICDAIRDRVVSGVLPVSTPIRQDALAKELGVSKIPLREACARLERDGLLISITNRGFFVPAMTAEEVEEIYALRLKLEPDAVARATKLATDTDRQTAFAALQTLLAADARDRVTFGQLHLSFHLALVRPCRQKITCQLLERLHVACLRYVNKHLEPSGRIKRAVREHNLIYQAWSEGHAKTVRSLTQEHIRLTLADLREQLSRSSSPAKRLPVA